VANKLAKLAVLACGRMVGVFTQEDLASPKNQVPTAASTLLI
jgi:hypothetical protein